MPDQYPNSSNEPTQVNADEIALASSITGNPANKASVQQEPQNNTSASPFPNQNPNSPDNKIKTKKSHTKTVIASILGILLLAGGVSAGVLLVKQRQDIREKASGDCETIFHGQCVPESYVCTANQAPYNPCPTGEKCGLGTCTPPTPIPVPDCETMGGTCVPESYVCTSSASIFKCPEKMKCKIGGTCTPPSSSPTCTRVSSTRRETGTKLTITQDDINKCKAACPDGVIWVSKYRCDGINLSQGCQDNGTVLTWNAKAGDSFSVGTLECGTVQIDAGCKNSANTYGNVAFLSTSANVPCNTPAPTNPPTEETAKCLSLKAYDTNWNYIPNDQLSKLKAGDRVRFAAAGSPSNKIDKAKFIINGVTGPETTNKKPGSTEFYTEYVIPAGVTKFTVKALLHHVTLGWF